MGLSIIAAYAYSRSQDSFVIGKDNKLPWDCPEDLKRFKDITSGHTVIMGRKTFESIGRILPNRMNIVVTRQKNYGPKDNNFRAVQSIEDAIHYSQLLSNSPETFIIGGGEIYRQSFPFVDKLYLTEFIDPKIEGDVFFPVYNYDDFSYVYIEKCKDHMFQILSKTPLGVMVGGKIWPLVPKSSTV